MTPSVQLALQEGKDYIQPCREAVQVSGLMYVPMTEQTESMGDRLKTLRAAKGWSLREAATHLGVSHAALDGWEKGVYQSIRDPAALYRIASVYGTDAAYILWGADRTPPTDRMGKFKKPSF